MSPHVRVLPAVAVILSVATATSRVSAIGTRPAQQLAPGKSVHVMPGAPTLPDRAGGRPIGEIGGLMAGTGASPYLLTSTLYEQWDAGAAAWANRLLYTWSYDAEGNVTGGGSQEWVSGGWLNVNKSTNAYEGGRLQEIVQQVWSDSGWVNYGRTTYTYDSTSRIRVSVSADWADTGWATVQRVTESYDAAGRETLYVTEGYDGVAFSLSTAIGYTFDGSGREIERIGRHWDGSAWANLWRYVVVYDGGGRMTRMLHLNWLESAWDSVEQNITSYVDSGHAVRIYQLFFLGDGWQDVGRELLTLDSGGRRTDLVEQSWSSGSWVNTNEFTNTYDDAGNPTVETDYSWDGSSWANWRKITNTWEALVASAADAGAAPAGYGLAQNYPNPFNPSTTIRFTLGRAGQVWLKVYDVLGREVATLLDGYVGAGTHEVKWDAGDAPGGVYFCRLRSASSAAGTRKIMLVR